MLLNYTELQTEGRFIVVFLKFLGSASEILFGMHSQAKYFTAEVSFFFLNERNKYQSGVMPGDYHSLSDYHSFRLKNSLHGSINDVEMRLRQ